MSRIEPNEDAENLRKFLESDDAAMVQMGLSMAKGSGITEDLLGLVTGLYMWHEDKTVRAAAKSAFTKYAPDELKQILKDNWQVRYRTVTDEDALRPKINRIFGKFAGTELHGIDIWTRPFTRNYGPITIFIDIVEEFDTVDELKNALRKKGLKLSGSKANLRERLEKTGVTTAPPIIIKALEFWTLEDATFSYYIHHCMRSLGRLEDARAIIPIIGALGKHTSINNTEVAAEVLKKFGETAIDECINALKNSDTDTRVGAAGVLGIIGGEKAIAPLTDALEDNAEVRNTAVESLGKIGGKQDSGPIIKLLNDPDANVRYTAAESLGGGGDKNAVEPLIELLKTNTYHENDNWTDVRSAAAKALGKIGDLRMKEPLIEMLEGINKAKELKTDEEDDNYWEDESARQEGIGALLECDIKEELDIETITRGYIHFYGLSNCHDSEFLELDAKFIKWFTKLEPKYLEKLFSEANSMGKSTDYGEYGVVTKEEEDDYYHIWGCSRDSFPKIIQEFGEDAINPLIEILENKDYHYYLHQIAAQELGKLGDNRARQSLTKAHNSYSSHYPASYVHDAAEKALKGIKEVKNTSSKGKKISIPKLIETWNQKLRGKKTVKKEPNVKTASEFRFESSSTPGKFYTVTVEEGYYDCNCPGFMYRKNCSHLDKAKNQAEPEEPEDEKNVEDGFNVTEVDDEEMPVIFGMYLFGETGTMRNRAKRIFEYNYTKNIADFLSENFLSERMELGNDGGVLYNLGFWNDNTGLDWAGLVLGRAKCRICGSSTHGGVKFLMEKSGTYGGSSWKENYCTSCYSKFEGSNNQYKLVMDWWQKNFENIISSGGIQKTSVRRELEAKQKEVLKKELKPSEIIEMLKKSDPLVVFDGLRISENNPNDKDVLSYIIPLFIWDEEETVRTKAEEIIAKNLSTEIMIKLIEKIEAANLGPFQVKTDYESFDVAKLKKLLKQMNLPVSGRKNDLVKRITENNCKNQGEIHEIVEEVTEELKNNGLDVGPFLLSVLKYIKINDSDFGNKIVDILNKYSDKAEAYENEVFNLGWGAKIDDYPINSYHCCLHSLAKKESSTKDMIEHISKDDVDLDDVNIILKNLGKLNKKDLSAVKKYLSYSGKGEQITEIWNHAKNILIKHGHSEMEILEKSIESIDNSGYPSPQCIESTKRLGEIKSKESLDAIVKLLEKVQTKKLNSGECGHGLSALNNLKEIGSGKTKTKIIEIVNYLLDKAAEKEGYLGSSGNYDKSEIDVTIGNIIDIINYYKSETSAEALIKGLTMSYFWNYDGKFAIYSDGTLSSGQKILNALRNIGNPQSKDILIVALKNLEMKTGDETGSNSWAPQKIIFATLLSICDDMKRLQFFVDHWEKHEKENFRMDKDVKKLYDIVLKDNTEDNIASLIKELVGKNHTLYKNYFSNIGGKDDPRKFLMSDDPGMQLMGISLAKGLKYPEDIRPILVSLSLFSSEDNIRKKALECVKDIGIDKITMPNEKDWNEEMNTRYFPGWYGNKKRIDPKPLIESLISLGSTKSLTNLKDIFKRISRYDKNLELIVKGITEFCNENEILKFYDELIEDGMGRYGGRIGNASKWGYNIDEDTRQRLVLVLSAYVEINAQGRHGIIFSKTFDELVRAITDKATTEEKQGDLRGFIKEGIVLCLELDEKAGNKERTLLTLENHLLSEHRERKIAASQVFEMLYKWGINRKRISEIVEPARKDRSTLVRSPLKTIK